MIETAERMEAVVSLPKRLSLRRKDTAGLHPQALFAHEFVGALCSRLLFGGQPTYCGRAWCGSP